MNTFKLPLFIGINKEEIDNLQIDVCIRKAKYNKNDIIFHSGEKVKEIGVVLSGSVMIENIDIWGNKSILSKIEARQIFAETYALCNEPIMVDVVCQEKSEILFINLQELLENMEANCQLYTKLLKNLLLMTAQKNMVLSNRIFCTTSKSARSRILTYLSSEALKNGSIEFSLPFNRQQMADYLNLDRSALSKELCRMRDEGILSFNKNNFKLIKSNK